MELLIEYGQVIVSITSVSHTFDDGGVNIEHSNKGNLVILTAGSSVGSLLVGVVKLLDSLT